MWDKKGSNIQGVTLVVKAVDQDPLYGHFGDAMEYMLWEIHREATGCGECTWALDSWETRLFCACGRVRIPMPWQVLIQAGSRKN